MINVKIDFDKDTSNRLLNDAFDIISEIKETLQDTDLSDSEALEQIALKMKILASPTVVDANWKTTLSDCRQAAMLLSHWFALMRSSHRWQCYAQLSGETSKKWRQH